MKKLSPRTKASRANGALGRGHKTQEGRQRSSLNAVRHGLLTGQIVLSTESESIFERHLDQYMNRLRPNDQVEAGIVLDMAAAVWRLRRLSQIEAQLMNEAMDATAFEQRIPHDAEANTPFPRTARAFKRLAAGNELQLLDRYESRLHRIFSRSLRNLVVLRQIENEEIPNEATSPEPEESKPDTPKHSNEKIVPISYPPTQEPRTDPPRPETNA
jgi:hypothetical protein